MRAGIRPHPIIEIAFRDEKRSIAGIVALFLLPVKKRAAFV